MLPLLLLCVGCAHPIQDEDPCLRPSVQVTDQHVHAECGTLRQWADAINRHHAPKQLKIVDPILAMRHLGGTISWKNDATEGFVTAVCGRTGLYHAAVKRRGNIIEIG